MFLHDMEELLKVSRGTAHAELKRLKAELAGYGLTSNLTVSRAT